MRWYLLLIFLCAALLAPARPVVQPAMARKARPPGELIPYRRASQWGYANAARRLVIRPQYDYAERFDHGLARVWKNDKCGFIDPRGKLVVPIAFDRAAYYLHEIQHEYQRGRGYELRQLAWPGGRGRVVVFNFLPADTVRLRGWARTTRLPPSLLKGPAAWFDESWLQSAGKWGLYDSTGRVVLPPDYAYLRLRADGLLKAGRLVRLVSGYDLPSHTDYENHPVYQEQLVTRQGRVLLKGQAFSELLDFHFGQLLVASDGDYGSDGREMTLLDTAQAVRPYAARTWYYQIEPLGDDGFIGNLTNLNPRWLSYGTPEDFRDDWCGSPPPPTPNAVLLNRDGQQIGVQQYVNLRSVSSGRALASIVTDGSVREGLLDTRTGQWVLPPIYEELNNTIGARLFLMRQQKRWGIIDSTGQVMVAPRYEALKWAGGASSTSTYTVQKNGKWGVIDYQGRELIAPRYDEVDSREAGYNLINRQKKPHNGELWVTEQHGEADRHGHLRIPVVYEDLRRSQDERGRDLPLWEATRAGRLVLLDTAGRLLLDLGASQLSNFRRNLADVYTRVAPDSLAGPVGLVQLDTTGHRVQVRRRLLPAVVAAPALGEVLGETWRTPAGQLLVRYTRYPARPLPPDSSAQTANRCWLTTADSIVLLPPIYHAIEPQQLYRLEKETPIGAFLRVRRGHLFGVVTAEGRPVLPVSYPEVLLPYGISGVFWVRLPTGYAAIDAQQRVLRHTHSATPPRLPKEFAKGYGLLINYSPQNDIIPVGYVDELGQPFFSEKPVRR